ncbi:hypothetical protein [Mucilaginibacter phyllosphaerae]|uniref:Anti-sigma factor n=1 Tax=Mucilaginibacter phyllosphaerae TaxID=1812349 RepID=A0A4Y8AFI0_9SPHI|nr:hypothetical protein [Mucilaginibacter phyllosphaerae]MBB3968835.1 hypothetical protein [Mucilaginibacter phyllosphaerae]TEW67534.1 hypothetical protein E2R65_05965 [Mucilaginibacter phyllosphaerae]GGH13617.1 hypothetical protein GCM10007352_21160 [Mucilaginibacter phyllosphaerae]
MIQQYINSGILEAYVTGAASDQEVKELLYMKATYPEVNIALQELEKDMELIAQQMAVAPPEGTWDKISGSINELIIRENNDPEQFTGRDESNYKNFTQPGTGPQYIEVESENNYMKVHKAWKWVFAAVFVLGKIFLGCAIYFYLENRQAQLQLKELKTELRLLKK